MTKQLRMAAVALMGAIGLSLVSPTAAHASKSGKRNTAIALGAVAAYGLIKKKPLIAGLAGAGAVYTWLQSNKDGDKERRSNRNRRRNRGYQSRNYDNRPVYYQGRNYDNRPVYYQPSYASPRSNYGYRPYQTSGYRNYNTNQSGNNCNTGYSRYNSDHPGRGHGHAYGRRDR